MYFLLRSQVLRRIERTIVFLSVKIYPTPNPPATEVYIYIILLATSTSMSPLINIICIINNRMNNFICITQNVLSKQNACNDSLYIWHLTLLVGRSSLNKSSKVQIIARNFKLFNLNTKARAWSIQQQAHATGTAVNKQKSKFQKDAWYIHQQQASIK